MDINAPAGLYMELTGQKDRYLLHLVNYKTDTPCKDVSVRMNLPAKTRVKSVSLASPERQNDLKIEFTKAKGGINFKVPQVRIYEIAIIEFRR